MTLGVDNRRAAVIGIDLHRGHLDMAVATMPTTPDVAERVVAANRRLFDWARSVGIPVAHLVTGYRDVEEIRSNPYFRARAEDPAATRRNAMRHNLLGSPGCAIMPGLFQDGDWVVDRKKRYNCFMGTDLDVLLRSHGINVLLITGVNTNSCVLSTTAAANARDYMPIVVSDCVDSMDGPEWHDPALRCIGTFGLVRDTGALMAMAELRPATSSSLAAR